ncbi:peptidoglycan-binding protein [Christensenellaceae bacterium NSJ-44]|uniref:Peptidoglycan-binding protein n=2 Tax=Luoshenia tenuis TaxID=2763654 RepID=A0A926HM41_9FIRM|nr:peptidoglycan-binding protein [Luoshenia tenuis]MBC8528738.1 peptidoglycan-binding protein [Luoshenia tenuis]
MNCKKITSLLLAGACAISLLGFSPAPAQAAGTVYRLGSEGEAVKKIQQQLIKKGYYFADVTGYYGEITTSALSQFQKYNDLEIDGVAGEKTLKLLFGSSYSDFINSVGGEGSAASSDDLLLLGDRGDSVSGVQSRLKELGYYTHSSVTGYFGPITTEAVKQFQSANGLVADGIVGPKTEDKLNSSKAVSKQNASKTPAASSNSNASSSSSNTDKSSSSSSSKNDSSAKKDETPSNTASGSSSSGSSSAQNIIATAKKFLGRPYVYGANGPDTFDCTGFTCYVFRQYGISLPRTAQSQGYSDYGTKISSASALQPGDLVFFNTVDDNDLSDHAGIYIGGGQFIHCSSGKARCVVISSLSSGYYQQRFSWGRRVL